MVQPLPLPLPLPFEFDSITGYWLLVVCGSDSSGGVGFEERAPERCAWCIFSILIFYLYCLFFVLTWHDVT